MSLSSINAAGGTDLEGFVDLVGPAVEDSDGFVLGGGDDEAFVDGQTQHRLPMVPLLSHDVARSGVDVVHLYGFNGYVCHTSRYGGFSRMREGSKNTEACVGLMRCA